MCVLHKQACVCVCPSKQMCMQASKCARVRACCGGLCVAHTVGTCVWCVFGCKFGVCVVDEMCVVYACV